MSKESSLSLQYPMLSRNNYVAWAIKMKAYMDAQGVWDAIEDVAGMAMEVRKDKMALAVIYQAIPEDMLLMVAEKKTAKEAWEMLKIMHLGADRVKNARVQTLKSEFEVLRMKESDSVDDFAMKLTTIVNKIRSLGDTMDESYVVRKFLRAMPGRFLPVVSTIEQFGDITNMSLEEVIGRLKTHEERISEGGNTDGSHLLLTQEEWLARSKRGGGDSSYSRYTTRGGNGEENRRGRGRGRGRGGRDRNNSTMHQECGGLGTSSGRDKSKVKCYNCNIFGHFASECRKPRKKHEEANLISAQEDEPTLLMAIYEEKCNMASSDDAKLSTDNKESNLWYLDNGASNHMTGVKTNFNELDEKVSGQVKFGDGSVVQIKGKGSVLLKCKNGEQRLLSEVYFIPNLRSNIISLGQLAEEGSKVVLQGVFLWVYDKEGRLLMKVEQSGNTDCIKFQGSSDNGRKEYIWQ
ncbi:unnamed protein product [Rhodiola kirilowii]